MKATERSRAYPVLSLEEGKRLMGEVLSGLGEGSFSREVLGEALGYSNAHGGPGARKIGALAQYGFLRRKAGLYSPTTLARRVVKPDSPAVGRDMLQRALRQPPLFGALLDRYEPQGRVPSQLAGVLWREYGITRKASHVAAETFGKSARFAEVIDLDGTFISGLEVSTPHRPRESEPNLDRVDDGRPDTGSVAEQRFEFALTKGQVARLFLPLALCRRDLEIVQRQIEFLEYQVIEEESA